LTRSGQGEPRICDRPLTGTRPSFAGALFRCRPHRLSMGAITM